MVEYKIKLLKSAKKDVLKIKSIPALKRTVESLIELLKVNPFSNPPPYEKLKGDFDGLYSRRINVKHRLVYRVDEEEKNVIIVIMWTHYEF